MSDPRQEQRLAVERWQRTDIPPTQLAERIKQGLSPCDDDLPFAQAVRQKDEIHKAAKSFRKHQQEREAKPDGK